jgi:hypothetical protein
VISLNANGIRAAARKGFFEWLKKQDADVVCIQETKAQVHQLGDEVFSPAGYHCYYEDAVKKGYSGVAIYTRHKPKKVVRGYGDQEFDDEGRYLEVQLGGISVVSLYLPSGSSKEERQIAKYRCMDSSTLSVVTGISFTKRKTSKTGSLIKRIPAVCPRNAPGWTKYLASIVTWTRFARWSRNHTNTPGGQTVVAPGITMLDGGSTIRLLQRVSKTKFCVPKSTGTNDFPIMHQ